MTFVERAKKALAVGPAVSRLLAKRMDMDYPRVQSGIFHAVDRGAVIVIGTFGQARACASLAEMVRQADGIGNRATRQSAPVFALPGTKLLDDTVANPSKADLVRASQMRGRKGAVGAVDQVRAALADESGLTKAEVIERTGLPEIMVRRALSTLTRFGGAYSEGPRMRLRYSLFNGASRQGVKTDPEHPYRRALPITRGRGSRWFVEAL